MQIHLFVHRNRFGEILHYITCSPMDPLQRMGAVRIRDQTADKKHYSNPQVIHTIWVHQLMSCEVKSSVKNLKPLLQAKIWVRNPYKSEKVHLLLSSHIKIHLHIQFETVFLVNNAWVGSNDAWSVHISLLIQMRFIFFTGESILWIMDILIMDLFFRNMALFV